MDWLERRLPFQHTMCGGGDSKSGAVRRHSRAVYPAEPQFMIRSRNQTADGLMTSAGWDGRKLLPRWPVGAGWWVWSVTDFKLMTAMCRRAVKTRQVDGQRCVTDRLDGRVMPGRHIWTKTHKTYPPLSTSCTPERKHTKHAHHDQPRRRKREKIKTWTEWKRTEKKEINWILRAFV